MSINPSYNYLLKSKEETSTTEPESKTRLTLNNPSYNYLTNTSQISTSPAKPMTSGSSFNYLMDTSNIITTKDTLEDLRNDKEFQERSNRFLSSLDEGETVDDVFGYFRGADYNIQDTAQTYFQSTKFNDQQKQDYAYLRDRFDNAEVGGFVEGLKVTADIGSKIITDPTLLTSAFFVPWTGGTSLAARIATGKAAQEGLKKLTSAKVAKQFTKGAEKVAKKTYQSLPESLGKNTITGLVAVEGFGWGSTNNYLNQNINVNVGRREEVSPVESVVVGGVTAAVPFALRGAGATVSKFKDSVATSRASRIEGDDYKGSVFDLSVEKYDEIIDGVLPNYRRLSGFVNKPTSRFIQKIKEDENLAKLIKLFRYDASKQVFGGDALDAIPLSERSYYERLNALVGKKIDEVDNILFPLYEKGKRQVPKFGSRDSFISIGSQKVERESFMNYLGVPDNVNNALAYIRRSGMKETDKLTRDGKKVSLQQAFNLTDDQYKNIFPAAIKIDKFFKSIRNDAVKAGIKIGDVTNYLPRGWNYAAIKQELKNLDKGIEGALVKEIKLKEGFDTNTTKRILEDLLDPEKRALSPFDDILKEQGRKTPAFVKQRQLTNIDDSILTDYLDNSLENILRNYANQSSAFIQRKIDLGETVEEFRKIHLDKIQNLTKAEREGLENIYRTMTGQFKPPRYEILSKIATPAANFSVVLNQLALLPLATITSLSEVAVPLVRGAGSKKEGINSLFETVHEYRKMWWNDTVTKNMPDARPEAMKELNRFNRAMRGAAEDRSLAMYGQAFGPRAMRIQNKFFKINLLHDWTKFVQLTSFKVGKSKIYDNLNILATTKNLDPKRKLRLENQLRELGVDINGGLKWVKAGAKPNGKFYDESLLPSAARYVDEVIMNPTAAANQKPIWHSMPSTRWAFGLMGFPTAFSNTVLKNAIREVSLDVRTGQVESVPSVMAGITTMTGIAMFGNTLRSNGDNLDRLANDETELSQEIFDAAVRTGLLGPTEQLYRTVKGTEYDNFARSITQRFTGPAVDDIFRFFDDYVGPLAWAVDEFPGITALKSTNRELYDAIKKGAREYDKEHGWVATGKKVEDDGIKLSNPTKPLSTSREGFAEGLEVNVPYTKDEPEERINPFTGEPYTAIYKRDRIPLVGGGPLVSKLVKEVYDELGLTEKSVEKWQAKTKAEVKIKEEQSGLPQRVKQNEEIVIAANKLKEGDIKQDEYIAVVREKMPIRLATEVPEMPQKFEIAAALKTDDQKTKVLGVRGNSLKENEKVGLRLDIPSYDVYDKWIVSIHDGVTKSGKAKAYAQTGWIKDVKFGTSPLGAFNIATKKINKTTIGRMFGKWKNHDPEFLNKKARELLNDPEWTQVGFNPYRHSYFYEKATGDPVVSASEVIQIGPLVLAKNIKKTKPTDKQFEIDKFFKKGEGKKFNFTDGGLATDEIEEHLIYKMLGS